MSTDFLPRIGSFFQQENVSSTRVHGGLGLNLTLVKRFLAIMGGTLSVHSERGIETEFTATCPCSAQTEDSSVTIDIPSTATHDRKSPDHTAVKLNENKILIVDDNDINQKVLLKMLRDHAVIVASNGQEAVERLIENGLSIRLILMDIQMPIMDGYEATRAIREAGFSVPIVAVTANASGDNQWRISGMDDYIQKPLKREKLEGLLLKYVTT